MVLRSLLFLSIVAIGVAALSCNQLTGKDYKVEKTSPTGLYHVKVEARVEDESSLMFGFKEQGKIQVLKGPEVAYFYEWNRKDNFESTFIDAYPVVEWIGDNVLRMGQDRANHHFLWELVVANNTGENLKYANVGCGKYEQLLVFDLASKGQITLSALPDSPGVKEDGSYTYSCGYGGTTQSGKKFSGVVEAKDHKPIQIAISAKDVR